MPVDFCEHLESYGVAYGRARASYRHCVHLLETCLEEPQNSALPTNLAASLQEWLTETGTLRQQFKLLVDEGTIVLARNPEAERKFQGGRFPVCGACAFQVPRLEFSDFRWDESGELLFQEKPLPVPESPRSESPKPEPQRPEADTVPASGATI